MTVVAILLAGGHGTRFGGDKLLHPLPNGESVGVASAQKLITVFEHCTAVVRETDTTLQQALSKLGCQIVTQPQSDAGIGDNLALGVAASQDANGWVIALADMPWIQMDTLRQIRQSVEANTPITAPVFNNQRGHPVGFNQCFREQLLALHGDSGAKSILKNQKVTLLPVDDVGILKDVDRQEDLL